MAIKINWRGRAVKDLRSLPSKDQAVIRAKVNAMEAYPDISNLDVKKLTDKNGQFRLRVMHYRVVFEFVDGDAVVIEILRVLRRTSVTY